MCVKKQISPGSSQATCNITIFDVADNALTTCVSITFYLFAERYPIAGLTSGSMKGNRFAHRGVFREKA